jgi:hypothetical protein
MEWDNQARERGARGEERISIAKNLLAMGIPLNNIVEATGLTREDVESLQVS